MRRGRRTSPARSGPPRRRGAAAVIMVVLMVLMNLIIAGMVLAGARDERLTLRRVETVQAFYAAEAGMNMAIRELMLDSDEDGDGGTGTISDDSNDAPDPSFGLGTVVVTSDGNEPATITSRGRAGEASRELEAVVQ